MRQRPLTPSLGIDYAHIRQRGYRERDPGGTGSRVFAGGYNSLRPHVGLALDWTATKKLALGAHASYRYETMDSFHRRRISQLMARETMMSMPKVMSWK